MSQDVARTLSGRMDLARQFINNAAQETAQAFGAGIAWNKSACAS